MIFAAAFVTYLYFYKDISSSGYSNYIISLTFLATFFPLIILIYQYQENNSELEKQKSKDVIRQMEADTISFEMMFIKHYPYLARLYQQIYPSRHVGSISLPSLTPEQMKQRDFFEIHMCSIMFQYIENTLLTFNGYNLIDDDHQFAEWVLNWRSWFQSDIVKTQWENVKQYYGENTQDFIEQNII